MARKRQSKENWRKRGAVFDEASRTARERKDQLVRTGGSVAQISDADLFVVDKSAKSAARKPRAKPGADPKAPKQLWVDRNVAPNPHIPTVGKVEQSRASQLRERRVAKLVGASQRRRAQGQPSTVAVAEGADLDIWAGPAAAPGRKSKRPRPAEPSSHPAISVAPEGASYRPSHAAHQVLLFSCCRCCCCAAYIVGVPRDKRRLIPVHQELLGEAVKHELDRQRLAKVRPYLGCILARSRLDLGCISTASRLYLGYISAISRRCWRRFTAPLRSTTNPTTMTTPRTPTGEVTPRYSRDAAEMPPR